MTKGAFEKIKRGLEEALDAAKEEGKWYALIHPGAPRGIFREKPNLRPQDEFAEPAEGYAVVFFPKVDCLPPASLDYPQTSQTLSQTPEAAIAKFMDRIKKGETWETYQDAGHCVRRVRITDLGRT